MARRAERSTENRRSSRPRSSRSLPDHRSAPPGNRVPLGIPAKRCPLTPKPSLLTSNLVSRNSILRKTPSARRLPLVSIRPSKLFLEIRRSTVSSLFTRIGRASSVDGGGRSSSVSRRHMPVKPHSIRATAATNTFDHRADIAEVQRW